MLRDSLEQGSSSGAMLMALVLLRPWSGTFHWLGGPWGTQSCARRSLLATLPGLEGLGSEVERQPV